MNKKIIVLSGGQSSERDISLASGKAVADSLVRLSYNVINIDVDMNLIDIIKDFSPDLIFNALHGSIGENGVIAGLLEIMQIPYTHSGVMASAIGMNKLVTKHILKSLNIDTPNWQIITSKELLLNAEIIPYPYVIKPIDGGSSIDVNIVCSYSDHQTVKETYNSYTTLLIEEYISGKELHTGILFNDVIGTMEVNPKNLFYDYAAKYTEGLTKYIFPAEINETIYKKTLKESLKLYNFLNCKTMARCDFRYNEASNQLKMLEINTHPGFTSLSLVPKMALHKYGMTFDELVDLIVKNTLKYTEFKIIR